MPENKVFFDTKNIEYDGYKTSLTNKLYFLRGEK